MPEDGAPNDWQTWLVDAATPFDGLDGSEIDCHNLDALLDDPGNLIGSAQEVQAEGDANSMAGPCQADQGEFTKTLSGSHALLTDGVT